MYLNAEYELELFSKSEMSADLRHLPTTQLCDALEVGDFPSEVFDDLHGAQELLQQLRPLVRPCHGFMAKLDELPHYDRLNGRH